MELHVRLYHRLRRFIFTVGAVCAAMRDKKTVHRETIRGFCRLTLVYFSPSTSRALQLLRPVDLAKFLAKFKPCSTAKIIAFCVRDIQSFEVMDWAHMHIVDYLWTFHQDNIYICVLNLICLMISLRLWQRCFYSVQWQIVNNNLLIKRIQVQYYIFFFLQLEIFFFFYFKFNFALFQKLNFKYSFTFFHLKSNIISIILCLIKKQILSSIFLL